MTAHRDVERALRWRKFGAALVIAAGALLTALSVAGVVIEAFGDRDYETFDWPVYAVLAIASVGLLRSGIKQWLELRRGP